MQKKVLSSRITLNTAMKQIILTNSKYSNFCSVSNNQRSNSEFKNNEEIVLNTKGNDIFGNKSSNYGIKDGKEL